MSYPKELAHFCLTAIPLPLSPKRRKNKNSNSARLSLDLRAITKAYVIEFANEASEWQGGRSRLGATRRCSRISLFLACILHTCVHAHEFVLFSVSILLGGTPLPNLVAGLFGGG